MACLNENLIVAFFSPDRSAEVVAEVDAHAAGCEACRRLLAEYAKLAAQEPSSPPAGEAAADVPRRGGPTDPADLGFAALPSLTPITPGERAEGAGGRDSARVELVQRLYQAHATKRIGTVLKGKWEIERLLGAGGMAFVFAAKHRNGRRVAIKMMRPELALEPALVERFLREGYVANKIEHPGAVAILDDDIAEDGTPFLVMELLAGETLRQRLARGAIGLDEALRLTAEVLEVLAIAHEKGIVHRDLKPDNLFQTERGAIKVLDFGIARLKEQARPEFDTRSGTTMGTIGYMPPEQARGLTAEVDARTDVWAIGATLYSLLTARSLHEAATTNEALLLAMTTPVPPMREHLPWLPVAVQALLDEALAFDRDARFASARAMKNALDAARAGSHTLMLPSMPPRALPLGVDTAAMPAAPAGPESLRSLAVAPTVAMRGTSERPGAPAVSMAPAGAPMQGFGAPAFVAPSSPPPAPLASLHGATRSASPMRVVAGAFVVLVLAAIGIGVTLGLRDSKDATPSTNGAGSAVVSGGPTAPAPAPSPSLSPSLGASSLAPPAPALAASSLAPATPALPPSTAFPTGSVPASAGASSAPVAVPVRPAKPAKPRPTASGSSPPEPAPRDTRDPLGPRR